MIKLFFGKALARETRNTRKEIEGLFGLSACFAFLGVEGERRSTVSVSDLSLDQ
jgi:hypothetical protein